MLHFNGRENGHSSEVANLKEENGHVTEVVSLIDGEWSCYRCGQFNGGRIDVTEVVSLMAGEWCYGGGQLKKGEWLL